MWVNCCFSTGYERRLFKSGLNQTSTMLSIYQFRSAAQSGGGGKHDRMSLMMRPSPRVSQEVLLRATFLG